jgi:16S rRNA (cytosine1402-N4)-methyltransferase
MFINDELGQLEQGLTGALNILDRGGRLAVISFHSLEDRMVKRFIKRESEIDPALADLPVVPPELQPRLKLVGRKSRAAEAEVGSNPRSRSALLRVAEKVR